MVKPIVRAATSADAEGLSQLYAAMLGRSVDVSASERILDQIAGQTGHMLLVAEAEGKIVATLAMIVVPSLIGSPFALFETFFVAPGLRRQGIGRGLMQCAVELAKEAGCFGVNLLSGEGNNAAHALFEALGFEARSRGYLLYF